MSVINQMLRDLDARNASTQERAGLPPRLRTLPPMPLANRAQSWRVLAIGMVVGAALASLLTIAFMSPAMPPAPAVQPVPAPMVAPAQSAVPPAPTSVQEEAAGPAPANLTEMKFSTSLVKEQVTPPVAASSERPAAAVPKPAVPKSIESAAQQPAREAAKPAPESVKTETRKTNPPAPVKAAAAEAPAADAQINKQSKGGMAHDAAEVEYRKGMQAVKRGDNATAQSSLQRALTLDPGFALARQALLSVLVGSKQWPEAREVAESGLALDPRQSGWAMILARLQFEQGDAAAAVETLGRHVAHADKDADYQGLYAYLLQKQQRSAEAAERFKAALALRPGEGRWWFGLGLALESAGQGGEAKDAYIKAKEAGNLPADMAQVVVQKLK